MQDGRTMYNNQIRTYTFDAEGRPQKSGAYSRLRENEKKSPAGSRQHASQTSGRLKGRSADDGAGKSDNVKKYKSSENIRSNPDRNRNLNSDHRKYVRYAETDNKKIRKNNARSSSDHVSDKEKNVSSSERVQGKNKDIPLNRGSDKKNDKNAGSNENIHTINALKRNPFPTSMVIMAVICTVLFMFMIISYVKINEYTIQTEELERQISLMNDQKKELTLELEKKNNLKQIEEYATEKLGMVKIDQLAKKYISVDIDDKIEIVDKKSGLGGSVGRFFDSVASNFKDLISYISKS